MHRKSEWHQIHIRFCTKNIVKYADVILLDNWYNRLIQIKAKKTYTN